MAGFNNGSGNATSLQSVAISSTTPTLNQVLTYNGTSWVPATGGGSTNATQLQGVNISSTAPTTNQVLTYNGTAWTPITPSSSSYTPLIVSPPPGFFSSSSTPSSFAGPTYTSIDLTLLGGISQAIVAGGGSALALAPTKGIGYYSAVYLPAGTVVSKLWIPVEVAGSSATCYAGIYSANAQLGVTSSFTANATGWASASLTTPFTVSTAQVFYIGVLVVNSSTTSPQLFYIPTLSNSFTNYASFVPAPSSGNLGGQVCSLGTGLTSLPSLISGTPTSQTAVFVVGIS